MKTIFTLVLAALGFTSLTAATQFGFSEIDANGYKIGATGNASNGPKYYSTDDSALDPTKYITSGYTKSVQEKIAADNQIIESTAAEEIRPLFIEIPKQVIVENNDIIEGNVPKAQPLNFGYINKKNEIKMPVQLAKL
jgi:hypothetical protein